MSNDIIILTVPAKPEYVMVARLTSAAFASRLGFDIDQIEDIKCQWQKQQYLFLIR